MDLYKLEKSLTTKTMKMDNYAHHCKFLTQCIENKVVPKGRTAHIQLNIPGNNSDRFKHRAQCILRKASRDTMLLGRYQGLIQDLKTRITAIKTNNEQKPKPEVTRLIHTRVDRKMHREENHRTAKLEKKDKGPQNPTV